MGCDVQQTRDGGYIFLYNDDYHFILVKTDDDGNIIWNKYFGESIRSATIMGVLFNRQVTGDIL